MRDLYILDVSAIVHTGANESELRNSYFYKYPVGGMYYFNRYLSTALAKGSDIILCFDSRSKRLDWFPDYKKGRPRNPNVVSQIETIYESVQACGIPAYKEDGLEGDDLCYWSVQQNKSEGYYEISVLGNDYDLCHNVQPGVRFKSITSNTNSIYTGNFRTAIKKGRVLPLNTIAADKVFCGCSSDKIPSMKLECGLQGEEIFERYLNFIDDNGVSTEYSVITKPILPLLFAAKSGLFTEKEVKDVQLRVKLVYPLDLPEGVQLKPVGMRAVSKEKIAEYFTLYNDTVSLKTLGLQKSVLYDSDFRIVKDKADRLLSGEFAADRNMEISPVISYDLDNMEIFEKEF